MPPLQCAAQLYTLRDFLKEPADIRTTLSKLSRLGYRAVQLSALGPMDPAELHRILQGEGLTCCATHEPLARLQSEPDRVIEEHRMWQCVYTAIGGHHPAAPSTDDWHQFARDYSDLARKFAAAGIHLGYHNHSHELAHFDGKPALARLIADCAPEVWFELDTYWITHGGGDPVEWIGKVKGRIPCIHLKDMTITPAREQRMAPVGEGNLNWPAILRACRDAGVQWAIVEQDDCYGEDPFQCLGRSLQNLQALLEVQ